MKILQRLAIANLLVVLLAPLCAAETIVEPGDVSGTWTASGNPYLVQGYVVVPNNETLLLESGVIVLFDGGISIEVLGNLHISGTPGSEVLLDWQTPPYEWGGIVVDSGGTVTASYATLSNAGSALTIYGTAILDHCTLSENTFGFRAYSGTINISNSSFLNDFEGFQAVSTGPLSTQLSITGSSFTNCPEEAGSLANSVQATLTSNTATEGFNGFEIQSWDNWYSDLDWTSTGVPLVMLNADFVIPAGRKLTLKKGTVLKSSNYAIKVSGELVLESGVVMTSLNDDIVNDTWGDGTLISPLPGDWPGIIIDGGIITADTASFYFAQAGITTRNGGSGIIVNSVLAYNGKGAAVESGNLNLGISGGDPVDDGNNQIFCNGVNLSADAETNAENNFWIPTPPNGIIGSGPVNYLPTLPTPASFAVDHLILSKENVDDLILNWHGADNACGYRVYRSQQPESGFADISGPVWTTTFTETNASPPSIFYYRVDPYQ